MTEGYFHRLHQMSNSRFWINNPTKEDAEKALKNDVFSCTTNPAYCSKLIANEKEYITSVIDEIITYTDDYDELAETVYRTCTKRLMQLFMPLYEASNGTRGFVTLQDDTRFDSDAEHTIHCIKKNRSLSPNYMAKLPVISGGIQAIEQCVQLNIPICATEVFSVSQAMLVADRYQKACEEYGNTPPIYITHISGVFDEYLEKYAKRNQIIIDPEVMKMAGIAVARKQYKLLKEKGYRFSMLGGGARAMHHFIKIMGDPHITINWSTAQEILDQEPEIKSEIDLDVPDEIIRELKDKFVDFRRAYDEDAMTVGEFANYGPVQLFRNSFLKGWHILLAEIADRKLKLAK